MPVVAIVGRPNVGKSTFLAHASGRYAESANVPGSTVAVERRQITSAGRDAVLVDLPGTLTIADRSDGLPPFWQLLLETEPDALLVIVDAGDLARHLPLVLACRDLGMPLVVAANLYDEAAAKGIRLDLGRLSQLLVAPVFRTVGRTGDGVSAAVSAAVERAAGYRARGGLPGGARRTGVVPPYRAELVLRAQALARGFAGGQSAAGVAMPIPDAALEGRAADQMSPATDQMSPATDQMSPATDLRAFVAEGRISPIGAATLTMATALEPERWSVAERWAVRVETRRQVTPAFAERLGRLSTSPRPGIALLAAVTVGTLAVTMGVGTFVSDLISNAWTTVVSPPLTAFVNAVVPIPEIARATLWAVDSGLLAILTVGIPFVLTFSVILAALEDSGYLAAAAVLTDRLFNAAGLPGRAAIPILAATGCNVPAIYGTRVLETRRERLIASFLIVLAPCSARSAVVIAALAPFVGPMAVIAAFGVVVLVAVVAGVCANRIVPGRQSPLILDLPTLRRPICRQVWRKADVRFRSFVRMAAPLMLVGSFVLGLAYEMHALQPIEAGLAPITVGVLGLPPVVGVALALGFLRKELALQLLVVLAVAHFGAGATNLSTFMTSTQLFVFAVVTAISIPCAATLASIADELGWRSAASISTAVVGLALLVGGVLSRVLA
jgi:ferrous iron transport protein B